MTKPASHKSFNAGIVASAVAALLAALVYAVVRSDFRNRGCHELTPEQWQFTANCEDGAGAMRFTMVAAVLCALVCLWLVWRQRNG